MQQPLARSRGGLQQRNAAAPSWCQQQCRARCARQQQAAASMCSSSRPSAAAAPCSRQQQQHAGCSMPRSTAGDHRRQRWSGVRCQSFARSGASPSDDEYEFSLTQYMVVLDKPIGLTLAPDPLTGQVYVQDIQPGLAADESRMVQVGDRLLLVSAASTVLGDDMWPASDLQRTRWAINNRAGKVKLVLERSPASQQDDPSLLPPWFFQGREGISTWQVPELQLPIRFNTDVGGELADSAPGVGRSLCVSFSRCLAPPSSEQARRLLRPGLVAKRRRAERLLEQLNGAAAAPEVDYASPFLKQLAAMDAARFQVGVPGMQPVQAPGSQNVLPFRRPNSGSATPSQSQQEPEQQTVQAQPEASAPGDGSEPADDAALAPSNGSSSSIPQQQQQQVPPLIPLPGTAWIPPDSYAAAYRQPRVVQVLPWLLVSDGRLLPADLAQLATTRALSSLLELRLCTNNNGLLCVWGQQPPPFTWPQEPAPPTLTPSDTPVPAPQQPPPLQPAVEQQQQVVEQQVEEQAVEDPGIVAVSMAALAGPDTGFASAAVAAAAAAAEAAAAAAAGRDADADASTSSESGSSQPDAAAAAAVTQQQPSSSGGAPGPALLQVHAVLHCMADLQRLSQRRRWRTSGVARYASNFGSWSTSPSASGLYGSRAPGGSGGGFGSSGGGGGAYGLDGAGAAAAATSGGSGSSSWGGGRGGSSAGTTTASGGGASGSGSGSEQGGVEELGGLGVSSRQILLVCEGGRDTWQLVGLLIAAWLHWCGGLTEEAAVQGVSTALGVDIDQSVLAEVRRLLLVRAKERFSRRMLTWPYGGGTAEVSGELLGGWTERVPMTRCTHPDGCHGASKGHFYLELKGLAPGLYHYKYIVDNTWAVDGLAPKTLDSQGNWNNVLEVAPPPRIETPEEQAHFAALQAMWSAFERKCHFVRNGHSV